MRGFKIATAAALLLAASSMAQAAETISGEIGAVDVNARTIELEGVTFQLDESIQADDLKVGAKVTVTYDESDGKMIATALTVEN